MENWQISEKRNNYQQILAWMIIIISFSEWGSFIIGFFINFATFKSITPLIYLFLGGMLFSPLFTILFTFSIRRRSKNSIGYIALIIPILLILISILLYLSYLSLLQIINIESSNASIDFNSPVSLPILGFTMTFFPRTMWLILTANVLIFWFLVPCLFLSLNPNQLQIHLTRETNLGILYAAIYFCFRFGAGIGILFRMPLIFIVLAVLWIASIKFQSKNQHSPIRYTFNPLLIPKGSGIGIITLGTFVLGTLHYSMNMMLVNSWVWIFVIISIGITEYLTNRKIKFTNIKVQICIMLISGICCILIVLCQFLATVLEFFHVFIAIGLLTFGFMIPMWSEISGDIKNDKIPNNPILLLIGYFMGILGFALPFIMVIADPFTSIFTLGFIIIFEINIMRQFFTVRKLNCIKN